METPAKNPKRTPFKELGLGDANVDCNLLPMIGWALLLANCASIL
jgi:hypothetical protein